MTIVVIYTRLNTNNIVFLYFKQFQISMNNFIYTLMIYSLANLYVVLKS